MKAKSPVLPIEKAIDASTLPKNVGVAVSGGIDSMVLLDLFIKAGVKPVVLNVEHGIRGKKSIADSRFVADFAKKNNLILIATSVDAKSYAENNGVSVELAARILRYEFFDSLLKDKKVDVIALAHHADDNAETILMRLFRGTGIKGLCGITERDGYIRPLLAYSRWDVAEYAEKNGIDYVEDETNSDETYTRNFIRSHILPEIKERYPDVINSFNRLSENAAEVDDYLESVVIKPDCANNGLILRDIFSNHVIVQKYSVNAVMRELGAVKDVEKVHLDAILELKNAQNNASIDLPFCIKVIKYGGDLIFVKTSDENFVEQKFSSDKTYFYRGYKYRFEKGDKIIAGCTVDPDKVKGCVIRTRRDGDKFCRVNGKNKLLSDFLNEKKLNKNEKESVLVLAKGDVVYAILGVETAEQAKAEDRYLTIIKERETNE